MRITLGNSSLVSYPQGGGHWSWFLQHPLGLKALGHDVFWLELMRSGPDRGHDLRMIREFFARLAAYGLDDSCALVRFGPSLDLQPLESGEIFGRSADELREIIRSTDLLLNFCCALREPLLSMFRYRALLDFDPGHLQISALTWDLNIHQHDVCLTIGQRINEADCRIPRLGIPWRTFEPCIYLPMWPVAEAARADAPFTSITQWTWEELPWNGTLVSVSKRAAYLKYDALPRRAGQPFELAANIGDDPAGDRERLRRGGWTLADPHQVAPTPEQYQRYIQNSRAEFMCAKPVHLEMKTGWFSDRSIAYLASGRPVLSEDSGFSERVPTGRGLLTFANSEEACAGVAEIDGNYQRHCRAARELAEDFFDSRKCLARLLASCEA